MTRTANKPRRARRGVMLAIVLITLIVVMLIGASLANTLVSHRRHARHREHQQQTLWVVESAAQRAAHRLASDDEYQGETWQVPGELLGGGRSAVAVIRISAVESDPDQRRVIVEATYPADSPLRSHYHREFVTTKTTTSSNESTSTSPGGSS